MDIVKLKLQAEIYHSQYVQLHKLYALKYVRKLKNMIMDKRVFKINKWQFLIHISKRYHQNMQISHLKRKRLHH